MTSSDREQLLVFLVEAELYEGRTSEAAEKLRGAAGAAGRFAKAGARGEGVGHAAKQVWASRGMGGRGGASFRKEALRTLGTSAGRTAATYGAGAAIVGGGALAARAAMRRRKARKERERED